MSRHTVLCLRALMLASVGVPTIGAMDSVGGEYHHSRRARRTIIVNRARPAYAPGALLGTFMPTPAVMIQGNYPVGGGYSPLGMYGDQSLSLYGPLSSFRSVTAPVVVYSRGYDGVVRPSEAIASSTPNLPVLSPVVYPTRANHYYAPRIMDDPQSTSAINWLDQN